MPTCIGAIYRIKSDPNYNLSRYFTSKFNIDLSTDYEKYLFLESRPYTTYMAELPCRRELKLYIKLSLILTVTLAVVYSLMSKGTKIQTNQFRGQIQSRVTHSSNS